MGMVSSDPVPKPCPDLPKTAHCMMYAVVDDSCDKALKTLNNA